MNRKWCLFHLKEAQEAIQQIIEDMEAKKSYGEIELMIDLGHFYHHANFAWNSRNATPKQLKVIPVAKFKKWSRYPKDLPPLGTTL